MYRWKRESALLAVVFVVSIIGSSFSLFQMWTADDEQEQGYDQSFQSPDVEPQEFGLHRKGKGDKTKRRNTQEIIQEGILSSKPWSFFHDIRMAIDIVPWQERCSRSPSYTRLFSRDDKRAFQIEGQKGKPVDTTTPQNRRIFYGSLIGDEPWELLEIMAAETHGIFQGMVFVESNRSQSFAPRTLRHDNATRGRMRKLFGTYDIQIRQYVNEDHTVTDLYREHLQRQEILKGWKEMGMRPEDVGYISDLDESFSRDFLRAVQTCPYVAPLDYDSLKCHLKGRIRGLGTVYEGSPECITKDRDWKHPDMILGACIEEIGDQLEHPLAERYLYLREPGFATGQGVEGIGSPEYNTNYANIKGHHYPLWSAADFRMQQGGYQVRDAAFHLHNWFPDYHKLRTKYNTYAHKKEDAMTMPLGEIHEDLLLMEYCLRNLTDAPLTSDYSQNYSETQTFQIVKGGTQGGTVIPAAWPIYFHDLDYLQRKHQAAQANLEADRQERLFKLTQHEKALTALQELIGETQRQVWEFQKQKQLVTAQQAEQKVKSLALDMQKLWMEGGETQQFSVPAYIRAMWK